MVEFYNARQRKVEQEKVYGDFWIRWFYGKQRAAWLDQTLTGAQISKAYGKLQSSSWSRSKIPKFIETFSIPMELYRPGSVNHPKKEHSYRSFNEFFIRQFTPEARTFEYSPEVMPAPCEARYFGYQMNHTSQQYPVKGEFLTADALLGADCPYVREFDYGPVLIARLCPVDYHRFHFPDEGKLLWKKRIPGVLDSVNPIALKQRPQIFVKNERQVSILQTKNFGTLAYIEIGAMFVGLIISSHPSKTFKRGEEKGYFLFGASCVIMLGQKHAWCPVPAVLEQTGLGRETLVELGCPIAQKLGQKS